MIDRIPHTRPAAGANSVTLSNHAPSGSCHPTVETGSKQVHCARGEAGGLGDPGSGLNDGQGELHVEEGDHGQAVGTVGLGRP